MHESLLRYDIQTTSYGSDLVFQHKHLEPKAMTSGNIKVDIACLVVCKL